MPRYGDGLSSDRIIARGRTESCLQHQAGPLAVSKAPLWVKNGPCYLSKDDEFGTEWANGYVYFVYLDDIVIYARSLADHNTELREVLDRLRMHELKLQLDKSEFLRKEVNYLGHRITDAGVRPDPQKVATIEQFPTPTNAKQLKIFGGMISYCRQFIPNCSRNSSPLYKLLNDDAIFVWTEAQENAFKHLKSKLFSRPILQYPDFSKQFILITEASSSGLGAVLSQRPVGHLLLVAYASRKLNNAGTHYRNSEKQLLATLWATKCFRPYL